MRKFLIIYFLISFCFIKFSAGQNIKTVEKQQEEIFEKLKNYRMPSSIKGLLHLNKIHYTEESRQRIQELLEDKWNDEEIDAFVSYAIRDTSSIKRRSKQIAKKTEKSYLFVLDSIMIDYRMDMKEYLNKNINVNNEIVLTAGWLDDERFIDILEKRLNDSLTRYNHNVIRIALARLGVQSYYSQVLENNKINLESDDFDILDKKLQVLLYLATQESIYEAAKSLSIKKTKRYFDEYFPYNQFAITDFAFYLKNLPEPFRGQQKYDPENIDNWAAKYYSEKKQEWVLILVSPLIEAEEKDIEKVRTWIRENKGNYEINRDAYFIKANVVK